MIIRQKKEAKMFIFVIISIVIGIFAFPSSVMLLLVPFGEVYKNVPIKILIFSVSSIITIVLAIFAIHFWTFFSPTKVELSLEKNTIIFCDLMNKRIEVPMKNIKITERKGTISINYKLEFYDKNQKRSKYFEDYYFKDLKEVMNIIRNYK